MSWTSLRQWFVAAVMGCLLVGMIGPGRSGAQSAKVETREPAEPRPDAPPERAESFLSWMVRASGLIGVVILGMSFYLVAVVVWMFVHYQAAKAVPPALVEELRDQLEHRQYDRAYARLSSDGSFLAQTLAAGVRKLAAGTAAAQRAMELVNEDLTMAMEHRTTYLATVGTLGPMVGLLGTVYGMIRSFQAIATMGSSPQATQLAAGISTSLFATLEGICVSVPAIAFYAYFRNRIARLSLEVQAASEELLEQFAPGVRAPHPLVTATTAAPPPRTALPPQTS